LNTDKKRSYVISENHLLARLSANRYKSNTMQEIANTLIIVPLSLIDQWYDEIIRFSEKGSLSVLRYYSGQSKDISINRIKDYDVVITTYGKISSEFRRIGRGDAGLMKFYWFRVILDEAHMIRGRKTLVSKAVFSIKAENRWCITGTPV
jgi:SNF2 family DNA or RNA helicase